MENQDIAWLKTEVIAIGKQIATQTEQIKQLGISLDEKVVSPEKWASAIKVVITALAAAVVSIAGTVLALQPPM